MEYPVCLHYIFSDQHTPDLKWWGDQRVHGKVFHVFFYLLRVLPISGRFLFAELILEAGKFVMGFYWEINVWGLLLEAFTFTFLVC